ncbi:aldo/keto reductase [Acidisoma silvae]|uniref:Aldo/keto reductase n=1 Tax=Acidisoma silvae TaxID=2802396 RepID=A0A963YP93_9PROT|nr:aldo/keto reductase [Acidisoma silvae]MCB8874633.1 aldo/keto reductase [Acidisoma silvae]
MDYIRLGRSGLKVSRIQLGCMTYSDPARGSHAWILNEEQSQPFFRQAIELGINFFDTANAYNNGASEEVLGRAIKRYAKRDEVVIGTKVFNRMRPDANGRGTSRKAIMAEIDASLMRLGMDYVDLYQIHRLDPETPMEETLEAMHDVVKAGKALYIGASSMLAWQFAKCLYTAEKIGWTKFISMQNHMNLMYREEEREMMSLCVEEGIGMTPWSPLARGRVTRPWAAQAETGRGASDNYSKMLYTKTEEADRLVVDAVEAVAKARGVPMAQVALAWLLQKPAVASPVVGATKPEQLVDAAAAVSLTLTAEEVAQLEAPYVPHPILGM